MRKKARAPAIFFLRFLCFLYLFCLFPRASGAEADTLLLATGGAAGVYYPLGVNIARLLTKHVPGLEVIAKPSGASAVNIEMIARHEAALALAQNDVAFHMTRGKKPVGNLRLIASLYPEQLHLVTSAAGGIKTFGDVRGKRVSLGVPGSAAAPTLSAIFSVAGLKANSDFKPDYIDFNTAAERIQDGQTDAAFVFSGCPAAVVTALAAQNDIDLVPFDDELLEALIKEYPYFIKDVIPADIYSGVTRDTPTAAVMAALVCDSELPDDLVYGITQALFENLKELARSHEAAKRISLKGALSVPTVPLHPGAARYYAEKGLELPGI